jgi:hypothetical protein
MKMPERVTLPMLPADDSASLVNADRVPTRPLRLPRRMGLDDIRIAITLVAFFGIPTYLIDRRFFKPRGTPIERHSPAASSSVSWSRLTSSQ